MKWLSLLGSHFRAALLRLPFYIDYGLYYLFIRRWLLDLEGRRLRLQGWLLLGRLHPA
jgi:hypothetical protein